MLKFKYIEMRNFLSFGNVAQKVELDGSPLSIIMGLNYDATTNDSDEDTRNGVGKSSVIQALNFAIYGKSVGNKIKVGNLVNKTNKRHCEVTLVFEKDGVDHKIIRKRGPTDLKYYIGEDDFDQLDKDEAQGENKDSQQAITEVIGMSQELFQQIVTITTSVDSFLGLGSAKQRQIIEELLTITQLSEKADKLKEHLKDVKAGIEREQFRVDTVEASNKKILESIKSLEAQSNSWVTTNESRLTEINSNLTSFATVDIEAEKAAQEEKRLATEHNTKVDAVEEQLRQTNARAASWETTQLQKIVDTESNIKLLKQVDIKAEIEAHEYNEKWTQLKTIHDQNIALYHTKDRELTLSVKQKDKHLTEATRIAKQIESTHGAKCHTCGGDVDKDKHDTIVADLNQRVQSEQDLANSTVNEIMTLQNERDDIEIFDMPEKQSTHYTSHGEALQHQSKLSALEASVMEYKRENNPYHAEMDTFDVTSLERREVPSTQYNNIAQVYQHISTVDSLTKEKATLEVQVDPYEAQINTLRNDSLQPIDYDELNRLRKLQEHQEFLVKLLTDKNSFVRKRIIDQNLSFLNVRLQSYMEKSGSMHVVTFMNDLTVDITKMGDSFDFDNLSRGEKNRVIIALTLAFRDMFESLNYGVNLMFIDELLDNGLDKAGCMSALSLLNDMSNQDNKNIFLITHREEIQVKCENTMLVVMENGFTTITQE